MVRRLVSLAFGLAWGLGAWGLTRGPAWTPCLAAPAASSCDADADVQRLTGPAREAFMTRCEAGRTPPIAGTVNEPLAPDDPAELCNAKAVGDKMTGQARENYVQACVKKSLRP